MVTVSKSQSFFELHFGWVVFLTIALVTFFLYQHALDSGFFLDDASSIRNEPLMLQQDVWPIFERFRFRFIGYLSFWLNYQISGEDPAAFRLVNLAIHAANGMFVYVLSRLLFSAVDDSGPSIRTQMWIALAIALVFIAHPLQTQAVTYIVQRLASLVTFFYLAALCAWMQMLKSSSFAGKFGWIVTFVLSAIAACLTKQNAFTLPLVLVLLDLVVFRMVTLRQWLLIATAIAAAFLLTTIISPAFLSELDLLTRETSTISRWEYMTHQWVVLWIYLYKVIWPYPQVLDYGFELFSFGSVVIIIAGIGHAIVLSFAFRVSRTWPLVSFGIFFFYLAHSIESGFIPIRDLAFEHRNYLPLFGLFFAAGAAGAAVVRAGAKRARAVEWTQIVFVFLFLFFAQATYSRNQMWAEQETLLKQDVAFNQENVRAKYSLAVWYDRNGRPEDALSTVKDMLRNNKQGLDSVQLTLVVALLIDDEQYSEALELIEAALAGRLSNRLRGDFLRLEGTALTGKGEDAEAIMKFEESMRLSPLTYEGGLGYTYSLIQVGRLDEAKMQLKRLEQRFGRKPRLELLQQVLEGER